MPASSFFTYVAQVSGLGELSMLLWLLIKGAEPRRAPQPPAAAIETG